MSLEGAHLGRIVLLVRDFQQSLAFYRDKLGLRLVGEVRDNWAVFEAGEVALCLHGPWPGMPFEQEDFGRSPDELLFVVGSVRAVREALIARGIEVAEPHAPATGLVVAEFADPDGRRLAIEGRA